MLVLVCIAKFCAESFPVRIIVEATGANNTRTKSAPNSPMITKASQSQDCSFRVGVAGHRFSPCKFALFPVASTPITFKRTDTRVFSKLFVRMVRHIIWRISDKKHALCGKPHGLECPCSARLLPKTHSCKNPFKVTASSCFTSPPFKNPLKPSEWAATLQHTQSVR